MYNFIINSLFIEIITCFYTFLFYYENKIETNKYNK